MRESILKKLTYFYMVPLLLVLGINCVFSLFKTTYFDLYAYSEIPKYQKDHFVLLFVLLFSYIANIHGYWLDRLSIVDYGGA